MSKLDDFLGLTDVSEIRDTVVIPFAGKNLEFVIRPLSESEHGEFQKRCNIVSKNKVTFDSMKYTELLLESCIVEPNFADEAFLKKVGCVSAMDFLKKKFPAGILMEIGVRVQKLSGFDTFEVEIEQAKN